jgi:hypothetical protein
LCFHHVPKGFFNSFLKCSPRHTQFYPTLFGPSSTSMDVKCKWGFKWDIYLCFYVEDAWCNRKSIEGPINVAPYYLHFFWGAPLFLRWIPPIHQESLLNSSLRLPSILSLFFVAKFHKVFHHFATKKIKLKQIEITIFRPYVLACHQYIVGDLPKKTATFLIDL